MDIAVITPFERNFKIWFRDNAVKGENYVRVSSVQDIKGRQFKDIIEGPYYWQVPIEVREGAVYRVV